MAKMLVGGAVKVVMAEDAAEEVEVSIPVALTVNVYAVPLDRPVTVMGEADPVAVSDPGELVTV